MVDNKFNTNNIIEIDTETIENNKIELNITDDRQLKIITNIHDNAEKFDVKLEETFKYLQIFSAICDSFSHGANDVANAVGPFFTIYLIYTSDSKITKNVDMGYDAYWILSLGGLGISIGLLLYGKRIINAMGTKLCKITASRGTCIELGSALVIIIGSRLKIPLSTTHCQVGSTVGVGLLENNIKSINWIIILKTISGWLVTCVIVGFTSGILVLQGIYAPSLVKE
jgi:sodium-dependent phosphate transporter